MPSQQPECETTPRARRLHMGWTQEGESTRRKSAVTCAVLVVGYVVLRFVLLACVPSGSFSLQGWCHGRKPSLSGRSARRAGTPASSCSSKSTGSRTGRRGSVTPCHPLFHASLSKKENQRRNTMGPPPPRAARATPSRPKSAKR